MTNGAYLIPFIQVGPLRLGTYGLMVWLAFFCAYFVLNADLRRRKLPGDALNIILSLVVAGLAGSKLYHLLEHPAEFFSNPIGLFFSSYGFAWFGGFLGGLAVLLWLARHYRVPILAFLDACSPAAALGYAIGRMGCLLSGDGDYGIATNLPWGMAFHPLEAGCRVHHLVCLIHGSLEPSYGTTVGLATSAIVRVHPTPIYEFIVGALIAWFLWRRGARRLLDKAPAGDHPSKPKPGFHPNEANPASLGTPGLLGTPGKVFAEYLALTGLARFLVEFIRINPRSVFGVLTNAQVASLLSIVAGVALIFSARSR